MKATLGISRAPDARAAVTEAVTQALIGLSVSDCVGGIFFCGSTYSPAEIAESVRQLLPELPTIGCTTDGEISSEGLTVDSFCILLLSRSRMRITTALVPELSQDSYTAGSRIAERLKSPTARALILLPDGLTGNGSAIIRGALELLGPRFVIAGGTAGDRGQFVRTHQFCNGEWHTDALAGMMFHSDGPLEVGFGVMAGWQPMGIAKEVTHAEQNTVFRIEGETALQVYSRFLGDKASQLPAIGVEYPFALVDKHGQVDTRGIREGEEYMLLRAPMRVDHARGSVTFAAEIPQGSMIKMTRARTHDVIEASREAARRARAQLGGAPDVVFFFSCMARKIVLGRKTVQEIQVAQETFGHGVPMIGFYTYGEIANCGEPDPTCRFHNETATFLALRDA